MTSGCCEAIWYFIYFACRLCSWWKILCASISLELVHILFFNEKFSWQIKCFLIVGFCYTKAFSLSVMLLENKFFLVIHVNMILHAAIFSIKKKMEMFLVKYFCCISLGCFPHLYFMRYHLMSIFLAPGALVMKIHCGMSYLRGRHL